MVDIAQASDTVRQVAVQVGAEVERLDMQLAHALRDEPRP